MRKGKFLAILVIVFIGTHARVVRANPHEDLTQLLRKVYPEQWSGRIEWYYTPERNVVSDLHVANQDTHDVVYFDSDQMKYVKGSIDFDGSESVSAVYDGEMYVAFYGGSQNPSIDYPNFNPVADESTILVYLYLFDTDAYKVENIQNQFVVHDLPANGYNVFFNTTNGHVTSVRYKQYVSWLFDKYIVVNGCPWATRVKSGSGDNNNDDFAVAYLMVTYKPLKPDFFDYARFYPKYSHDSQGRRIVFLGPNKLLAEDARKKDWPKSLDAWNIMLDKIESDYAKSIPPPVINKTPKALSRSNKFSYHTLMWMGIFLIGTGLAGIILIKIRK